MVASTPSGGRETVGDENGSRSTPSAPRSSSAMSEAQLVDVREPYEVEAGRIAGARHVELGRLPQQAATHRPRPAGGLLLPRRRRARRWRPPPSARPATRRTRSRAACSPGTAGGRPLEPEDGTVADH